MESSPALRRWSGVAYLALALALAACTPGGDDAPNAIVGENQKPGSPRSEWEVPRSDRPGIAGFATRMSVRPGETVRFKVDAGDAPFGIDVYRMGYYGGDGARRVASIEPSRTGPQPRCAFSPAVGKVDCSGWLESASWQVPDDAVSGVYLARLVRADDGRSNLVPFVVREREPRSALIFQTSDITWQAYNYWADSPRRRHNLYRGPNGGPRTKAVEASYDRPFGIGADRTRRTRLRLRTRRGRCGRHGTHFLGLLALLLALLLGHSSRLRAAQ